VAVVAAVAVGAFIFMNGGKGGETANTPVPTNIPVAAVATSTPQPGMSPAEILSALSRMQNDAKEAIPQIRQIDAKSPLEADFKTRTELEGITRSFFKREALRDQVFETEELYKALGMMAESESLEEILVGIQTQQVSALFDDAAGRFYVVNDGTTVGPRDELAIVAAYMSGMQQQNFNVAEIRRKAGEFSLDELRAVDAMIKGDIAQVLDGYISRNMTQAEISTLSAPLAENKLLAAPKVVRAVNNFQSQEGETFSYELFGEDGWNGVDRAYTRPPVSTEQVIHPAKYFVNEEVVHTIVPNIANRMGGGWSQVSGNAMGELLIRTYLLEFLGDQQAGDAAAGWGGDRYSLMVGPSGEKLLIANIVWDTNLDAKEFYDAYAAFMSAKYAGQNIEINRTNTVSRWIVPNKEAIFLGKNAFATVLMIASNSKDDKALLETAFQKLTEALQEQSPLVGR